MTPLKRARLQAQLRQAEFYLRQTVAQHQGYLQRLGGELQASLVEMERIGQRAASGRITPEDAEMARAEVARRVERLRGEIAGCNSLLGARRSGEAGGFIDLPLEEYAPRLGLKPAARARDRWEPRHYLMIAALAIVMGIACYAYYTHKAAPRLACEAAYQPAPAEAAVLTITNTGLTPILLHVPWQDPIPAAQREGHCGLSVFARSAGDTEMLLVPTMAGEWLRLGAPMTGQDVVDLQPGSIETLSLDLRLMRARIEKLEDLRVEATLANGEVLCAQEWKALPAAPLP